MIGHVRIILALVGLVFHILYLWMYVELHNLIEEKRIRLSRVSSINILVSENEEYYGILKQDKKNDEIVIHMEEYLLNWYIVTEKGYYIISRIGRKISTYTTLEGMPLKQGKKFMDHLVSGY